MRIGLSYRVATLALLLGLAACSRNDGPSSYFVAEEEPWRKDVELACLTSGAVQPNYFLAPQPELDGPKVCGALKPFEMTGAVGGLVELSPPALLRCPMVPAVEDWVRTSVLPAAERHFGQQVDQLTVAASYSCRPMNHRHGGQLSEHGYANAIDISAFTLEDGRKVTLTGGWSGKADERAFLRDVRDGACESFTTVLSPDHDAAHANHFHFDLRQRRSVVCK
ncbi:MAG: extensin family protein [Pseudomonadota bacterium]